MSGDEMFEKLGHEKRENNKDEVFHIEYTKYHDNKAIIIQFWNDKTFNKINEFDETECITMQELKAINKKCEELKWI